MNTKMTMLYWKGEKYWLGKLLEHPEIMTQGETLEELEENIKDAYLLMALDDVPEKYEMKEIPILIGKSLSISSRKRGAFFSSMGQGTIFI